MFSSSIDNSLKMIILTVLGTICLYVRKSVCQTRYLYRLCRHSGVRFLPETCLDWGVKGCFVCVNLKTLGPGPENGSLLGDGGVVRCLFLAGKRYQQIESFAEPEQQKIRLKKNVIIRENGNNIHRGKRK